MSPAEAPSFSVVIPTYNWSSALRLALESVRRQTDSDFEVLVVGDACTDDSEAVVRSFGDARMRWTNLPENCGSQWGPNNRGLQLARGRYIAYLGHDDLWWPTHLAKARALLEQTGADIVAATTLFYGPPGSGVRAVTGLFPDHVYTPRQFFPPSSMVHRRELADRVGGWRPPEQSIGAVDHDFVLRCHRAGARIVSTEELTAFKFAAAWRRNSYGRRDASEQQALLARMQEEGEAFRLRELTGGLRASIDDRLQRIELPPEQLTGTHRATEIVRSFKGSRRAPISPPASLDNGCVRFERGPEFSPLEWHSVEMHPTLGAYRWSGPALESTIVVPVNIDRPIEVTILILGTVTPETLQQARLSVNGFEFPARIEAGPEGAGRWICGIDPGQLSESDRSELRLQITVKRTRRPIDLDQGEDRRSLGLAVGWVEVAPRR